MTDTIVWIVVLGILGALLGSYAGAVITRYPQASALDGRSHCQRCGTQLRAPDLVPIVSYVFLRGRCRYCPRLLDWTYPAAETLGLLGLPLVYVLSPDIAYVPLLSVLWITSIILAGIDMRTQRLPNTWVGIFAATSGLLLIQVLLVSVDPQYASRFALALLATGVFYLMLTVFTGGKGMGFGDVKLAPVIAATVALVSWPAALISQILPFFLGTLMVMYRARKGHPWRGETLPFGPFLITAGWLAAAFGNTWWAWYAAWWQ